MSLFLKINANDNVAVALKNISEGTVLNVDGNNITIKNHIKPGHKFALEKIISNNNIIKYGYPIGHAKVDIQIGEWVHVHNAKTNLSGVERYNYQPCLEDLNSDNKNYEFSGFKREDGKVGIRNELWIVPTVGCVNGIGENIIKKFKEEVGTEVIESIDAIEIFEHNYGCSQLGEDHICTRTILGNIVKHPNAGGVLVIGLGCENNHMDGFKESLGDYNKERVKFIVAQDVEDEIEDGVKALKELYKIMKYDKRVKLPISELKIGLKCGGSDGLSGITANPLLGAFTDFLVAQGGTTVLTEVPEMFGAEKIIMNRCANEAVFNKTVSLINDFKDYFMSYNQPVYENPSPGNKVGGITTLEDKSLGCTQKGGNATVVDVLKYGEPIIKAGLNLLSAPGNDLIATTALGASGCQMALFTTGRGTPFGSFIPSVKISSNSELYNRKKKWIDFNAGVLLKGTSMEVLLKEFVDYVILVASGEFTNNEKNNIREISIFKSGVIL